MMYHMTGIDRQLVITALSDYARECSSQRLLCQDLLEEAEDTKEVPMSVSALYSDTNAFRNHMAERVDYFLSRQETALDLLVKIDAGEVVVDYDDSDNPF